MIYKRYGLVDTISNIRYNSSPPYEGIEMRGENSIRKKDNRGTLKERTEKEVRKRMRKRHYSCIRNVKQVSLGNLSVVTLEHSEGRRVY